MEGLRKDLSEAVRANLYRTADYRIGCTAHLMHPARSIDKFYFLFFETGLPFGNGVQLFQSSSSIASISSFVMSDSNLPVYFNNSAWLWRRFISSSALTMASRLVLALVCRIASRSVLSGIFTVVFIQTFSLRSESLSS